MQPNGTTIQASHIALIDAPHLPLAVQRAHIFPAMRNKALLSLGQFYDNGYEIKITASTINIVHQRDTNLLLTGNRDISNGMWTINISPQTDSYVIDLTNNDEISTSSKASMSCELSSQTSSTKR